MEERQRFTNKHRGNLSEYRYVLWGTAALVAINLALALPTGASKVTGQETDLVEKSLTGEDSQLIDPADGGDDIMTELAAAPVASKELSKLRGGFITRSGIEISVGFDFKTFLNGQLRVHNIFNIMGQSVKGAGNPGQAKSVSVGNGKSAPTVVETVVPVGIAANVTPAVLQSSVPNVTKDVAATLGESVQTVAEGVTGTGNSSPAASTPAVASTPVTPPPPALTPIVINEVTEGKVTLVTEIGNGTKVTNSLDSGRANTTIENLANGITIEQITQLSVGITAPSNFVSKVVRGRSIGLGRDVSNVMRSALLGAIAR